MFQVFTDWEDFALPLDAAATVRAGFATAPRLPSDKPATGRQLRGCDCTLGLVITAYGGAAAWITIPWFCVHVQRRPMLAE